MGTIITFGNFKGGTGKTTNATMIGISLSKRGNRVLLIDLDPQGNATNLYLKTKNNIDNSVTVFDLTLMAGIQQKNLKDIVMQIKENLFLLPSAADFSLFPRYMESIKDYNERVAYLSKLIEPIKADYDYILVDLPPTIGLITDAALFMSDWCIIVLQTHERSLLGAEAFVRYMQDEVIDKFGAPNLDILGILPVLLKSGAPVDMVTLKNAKEAFGEENIFKTKIKNMERLKRYDITGVTNEDMHDLRVSQVYNTLVDEVLARMEQGNE